MSIFKKMFALKNFGEWNDIIDNSPDDAEKNIMINILENFFLPDNIARNKFLGNLQILEYNDRGLAHQSLSLRSELDFTKFASQSIDNLAKFGNKPLGHYDWFIAGYPDVVNWAMDLDDAKLIEITGIINPDNESEFFNEENKFKDKYLRKLVDKFKEENSTLECQKNVKS